MPRKRQFLLWFHAGIAKQRKNIATSKICLTIFKMLAWANSPYQSLCKGIKPVSQITLFIISLGLFPNNLENVWLFLYLKRVCPVPERGYGVFTKWGYLAWVAVFRILINWMVLAILLLKIVQPSSELDRGVWFDFWFCFFPGRIVLSQGIETGFVLHYWFWNCRCSRCRNTGSENHKRINGQICSMLLIAEFLVLRIYSLVVRKEKPNYTGTWLKRIYCKLHWKWTFYTIT